LRRTRLGGGRRWRRVRQYAGHPDRAGRAGRLGSGLRFRADRALLVIAFAGRGHLVHVEIDLDLARKVAIAQHRGQQLGNLLAELVLHAALDFDAVAITRLGGGQQAAVLVDHFHGIDRQARHRSRHQIDDRGNLAVGKLAATGQFDHDRCRRRHVVAHEHRLFRFGKMDRTASTPSISIIVSSSSRSRGLKALAFQRPAGAHRQLVDHLLPGFGRGDRPVRGSDHAGLVKIAFRHGDRAGRIVDRGIDALSSAATTCARSLSESCE
jgi:hypothetical protein